MPSHIRLERTAKIEKNGMLFIKIGSYFMNISPL